MNQEKQDVFERLAEKMNKIQFGFPSATDGLHLKLLRWIYTPEEAEIAVNISPKGETVEVIALRLGKSVAEMAAILDKMRIQAKLFHVRIGPKDYYGLQPWAGGLWEAQFERDDLTPEQLKEFGTMADAYYKEWLQLARCEPAINRTIPVSTSIKSESALHPTEDVHKLIDTAKAICIQPCFCQKEREAVEGHKCTYSKEKCMVLSKVDTSFEKWPLHARLITHDEAHRLTDKFAQEGLIHTIANTDMNMFICNCSPCCCMLVRAQAKLNVPHVFTANNFVAEIDEDICTSCGICGEQCFIQAIKETDDEKYKVDSAACLGCGICVTKCPLEAIKLSRRESQDFPPSIKEWLAQKATNMKKQENH